MPTRSKAVYQRPRKTNEISNARTAIRNHCLECTGYQIREVTLCTSPGCWLFPFRFGSSSTPEASLTVLAEGDIYGDGDQTGDISGHRCRDKAR